MVDDGFGKKSSTMHEVLESARFVSDHSRFARINRAALRRFAADLLQNEIRLPAWDEKYHYFDGGEKTVAYLMVLDTLNFCFWPCPGRTKWEISFGPEILNGYYALAAALKSAVQAGRPVTEPDYLSSMTLSDLKNILGGRGDLQLMAERLANLHELGRVLGRDYGGRAASLVEEAGRSAPRLARLLARKLVSFQDTARYGGREVFFYKRAQILVADLYAAFGGEAWGRFEDMDGLTVFADYKLPQILRHLGILRYGTALARKVDHRKPIEAGSPEEVEIRANTLTAVDRIKAHLKDRDKAWKAFQLDWLLWNMGQEPALKPKPYHRTVTIFY